MRMRSYCLTDQGLVRQSNQDSILLTHNQNGDLLGAVCDGIGGGVAGDVASGLAAATLKEAFQNAPHFENDQSAKQWLNEEISKANEAIFIQASQSIHQKGMGTTLVGVLITDQDAYNFNIGDSRTYGLYGKEFVLLTEDHNLVGDLVKSGEISEAEAMHHPQRNLLTNALGIWDRVKIDINKIKRDFDCLLICSDGLHGYVSNEKIYRVLTEPIDIKEKAQKLVDLSKAAGGNDNVSVILIENGDAHEK